MEQSADSRVELAGAVALVGSGEYLDVMNETDHLLLNTLGGPETARVAVIPTASGLEPGNPERWNEMGVRHFSKLGAQVEPVWLIGREDASAEKVLDILKRSNFFYFSGGNPNHLIESLRDTPAWQIIREAHARGAVLAGCSAGAMAFGGYTINIRAAMSGQPPQLVRALGLIPGLITFPHFDRMRAGRFVNPAQFKDFLTGAPQEEALTIIGVDEDTALVHFPNQQEGKRAWQVSGRQTVSVFDKEGNAIVYSNGEQVLL
ncbi:MAG TPA: Type 1 glutamine amidotransferase-like domain-containing protein [Chloroflexia bacterium]|nr:Type 1 glutamine amidotransferase-like domain-containing protein [Chloroflexia bacterium]